MTNDPSLARGWRTYRTPTRLVQIVARIGADSYTPASEPMEREKALAILRVMTSEEVKDFDLTDSETGRLVSYIL